MNAYLASVLENVKTKHGSEPDFVQTVEEVLVLSGACDRGTPSMRRSICWVAWSSERMFTFRVVWCDDSNQWHTNRGWRCRFNGAIGAQGGLLQRRTCTKASLSSSVSSRPSKQPDRSAHRRRQGAVPTSIRRQSDAPKSCASARLHDRSVPLHQVGHRRSRR